jgi:hypothetical protein
MTAMLEVSTEGESYGYDVTLTHHMCTWLVYSFSSYIQSPEI